MILPKLIIKYDCIFNIRVINFTYLLSSVKTHRLTDFPLQTDRMVAQKRKIPVFLTHIGLLFLLTFAALGGAWQLAALVALAHLIIDAFKTWALRDDISATLTAFLTDQALHIATLIAAAIWWPTAVQSGLWGNAAGNLTAPALMIAGFILTVQAGGPVVGKIMSRFTLPQTGLHEAGKVIGYLERCMIFILVISGQPAGVGFLIAAKSVLRFETAKDDRETSEYVIIGTLASFAWALAAASITALLLEIANQSP